MSIRKCGIHVLLIQLSLGAIVKQDASNLLQNGDGIETQCEYYNSTCFNNHHNLNECQGFETCKDETHACFVVWNNNTNSLHKSGRNVVLMGCFESNEDCSDSELCVENDIRSHFFCCCRGNLCNTKFEWVPKVDLVPQIKSLQPDASGKVTLLSSKSNLYWLILILPLSIIILVGEQYTNLI